MSFTQHSLRIQNQLKSILQDVTGYDLDDLAPDTYFSEAGLDSLLLTQAATLIEQEYKVGLTFRHLVEEYTCLGELGDYIGEKIPEEAQVETQAAPMVSGSQQAGIPSTTVTARTLTVNGNSLETLFSDQLKIMQLQLQALTGSANQGDIVLENSASLVTASPSVTSETAKAQDDKAQTSEKKPARHTPGTRITKEKLGAQLTQAQQEWLDSMLEQYQGKYAGSKAYTQEHRHHLADPRTVSGFNPEWKEIIFPIVTQQSKGSKLWDVDGNELIDTSNGFGPILFGHSPDFVTKAVKKQLDIGIETGPQSTLAGEVAALFCELTGNERCSFASTGSEAVMGALRLARTVTGRNKVVMFEGSYHGIFDEVINRPGRNHQALPGAPGIPREATSNMLVLPWGEQESIETIKSLGSELAAVLVEPVQSRKPEFHSQEYLQQLRTVTAEQDVALILDEVVTGFRVAAGGIRERFGIDADMATYGKVVGGGYSIGIIGGKAKFMDALDGGHWQFGDESIPECGVTFFAGTFVRHPVALAAAKAILENIKNLGAELYQQLEEKTTAMASEAKAFIKELSCEVSFEEFASLFYVAVPPSAHWGHMLFVLMTLKGIHIQQYRPNFLTTEHSATDVEKILQAFKSSLAELVAHGFIAGDAVNANKYLNDKPPIPKGARLGRNAQGEPAYFIEDPENQGQYIEVGKP